MRRSLKFLLFTAATVMLLLALPLHARHVRQEADAALQNPALRRLQVTDLCLATEARYTRHPAMADRHAPFQEHPLALEHFPTGSLVLPPRPGQGTP